MTVKRSEPVGPMRLEVAARQRCEVEVSGLSVEMRPYDIHSGHSICTDILNMFDHVALVTIDQVGDARVTFHGAAQPGDSTVVFVRDVVVE